MKAKTPTTATRRSPRLAALEKPNGAADGGSQTTGSKTSASSQESKSPRKEEQVMAESPGEGGEMVTSGGSRKKRREAADNVADERASAPKRRKAASPPASEDEAKGIEEEGSEEAEEEVEEPKALTKKAAGNSRVAAKPAKNARREGGDDEVDGIFQFVGEAFSREEARRRWPGRYQGTKQRNGSREEEEVKARCHNRRRAKQLEAFFEPVLKWMKVCMERYEKLSASGAAGTSSSSRGVVNEQESINECIAILQALPGLSRDDLYPAINLFAFEQNRHVFKALQYDEDRLGWVLMKISK